MYQYLDSGAMPRVRGRVGPPHLLWERSGFSGYIQDLGPVKTMFHIDPNLYLVLSDYETDALPIEPIRNWV